MVHAEKLFMARQLTMKDAGRCTVVAFGNSDLDVTDRDLGIVQGTIEGQLYVVVNSKLTNLTDAPELVVMSGSFKGTVVVTDAAIITITEGTLTGDGAPPTFCPGGCKFTGKFRQPFTVHDVAVYKKDNGRLVPVLADERALGDPPCASRSHSATTNAGRGMIAVDEAPLVSSSPAADNRVGGGSSRRGCGSTSARCRRRTSSTSPSGRKTRSPSAWSAASFLNSYKHVYDKDPSSTRHA